MAARRGWYVALVTVVALGLTGCGSESPLSPPTGVDELVIPTPSPDPADFVRRVDNPWFPLEAGSTWTYLAAGTPSGTVTVTVRSGTEPVAGVETTAVERTDPDGTTRVDFYAQDRHGNVWWFGREREWLAGEDGAEAGLAVPARPRLGDGWRAAYRAGVVDVHASVESVDRIVSAPAGRYEQVLAIDTSSPLAPGEATRSFYARRVGLVEEASTEGSFHQLQLVSGP